MLGGAYVPASSLRPPRAPAAAAAAGSASSNTAATAAPTAHPASLSRFSIWEPGDKTFVRPKASSGYQQQPQTQARQQVSQQQASQQQLWRQAVVVEVDEMGGEAVVVFTEVRS